MEANQNSPREALHAELATARGEFLSLLHELREDELARPSLNPGWTNAEILAHMLFGFMVTNNLLFLARLLGRLPADWSRPFAWLLNSLTRPFNWFNGLGARMQARVFTRRRIPARLERVMISLNRRLDTIEFGEWSRGMYYPDKWDMGFDRFMTLEKLFRYPIHHFHFHLGQLAR